MLNWDNVLMAISHKYKAKVRKPIKKEDEKFDPCYMFSFIFTSTLIWSPSLFFFHWPIKYLVHKFSAKKRRKKQNAINTMFITVSNLCDLFTNTHFTNSNS